MARKNVRVTIKKKTLKSHEVALVFVNPASTKTASCASTQSPHDSVLATSLASSRALLLLMQGADFLHARDKQVQRLAGAFAFYLGLRQTSEGKKAHKE
eukprot:5082831-Amphidinium_carterae.1